MQEAAKAPIRRTLGIAHPAGRVVLASVLGAGAVAADIALLGTAAWLISRASQHPNESDLTLAIVGVQFFGLSRGFLRYGERLVGHDAAFRVLANLRVQVYQRLERLAPVGLPAFGRGDLLARMVRDVDSLQDVIIRVIPPFATACVVGLVTVAMMWWMLPAAGLVLAVALILAATVVPRLTSVLSRRRESRFAHVRGELSVSVVDMVEGAAELTAFGVTLDQLDTVRRHDADLTTIARASAGNAGVGLALTTLFSGLACWGCLVVGIPAVSSGQLKPVLLAVIVLIPLAAFELVVGLPIATQTLGTVRQAAARVFEVTDAPVPVTEPVVPAPPPAAPVSIELRAVSAGYPGATVAALRGVDLSLTPGRRVAVVGPSGAGKSTLAAVLLRFLGTASGAVTLNGVPLGDYDGDDVRAVVGMVGQDPYLFDTTLAENLRIGRREATEADLRAAIERVGLASWVDELPLGLGTEVGGHGVRLSGGQRQRVALARALLSDFPVLVLDEPTEHLDRAAADLLAADLLTVAAGRTLVLITHQLSGLEEFDEIVVIEDGLIIERGGHDSLLARSGHYSQWFSEEVEPGMSDPVSGEGGMSDDH